MASQENPIVMPQPGRILERVKSPADLSDLNLNELNQLAREIRERIVTTVAKTGGHLAPSLGVVELSIALHYVFEAPRDKIIWDVGHQAYAHKLLTGRNDRFDTIRQYQGISGFPKRQESIYDALDVGHASTSISAGLGMSVGKDLKGDDGRVIAIIGDGSITGGMAYEALNQAGHLDRNLIVIFNDNEMSIAPNVGALSSFLSRKLTGKTYVNFKERFINTIKSLPSGENVIRWAKRGEEAFKSFFTPGMLFEAFKFDYLGPIDGHRVDKLIEIFKNVEHFEGPLLIHIQTTKGRGFRPAEEDPSHFHGVGSFKLNGDDEIAPAKKISSGPPSYTKVFGETIRRIGREDERLVAITAAMPEGTGLAGFAKEFPERAFDVAIAEQHAVTFAAGLALEGFTPVVAIYSTFMQRAYDQVIHDVCLQNQHVILAMDRGGLVGEDGPTHHGAFDLAFMRTVPNLTLMVPRDENQLQHMLLTAVQADGPMALRYPRGGGVGVEMDADLEPIEIGTSELLRAGSDLLIVGVGPILYEALAVAEELESHGIAAAVLDGRFVKPLDKKTITDLAAECGRVLTLEENAAAGGFGSAVLEALAEVGLALPVKVMGLPDRFIEHGSQKLLRRDTGLDRDGIKQVILDWMDALEPKILTAEAR